MDLGKLLQPSHGTAHEVRATAMAAFSILLFFWWLKFVDMEILLLMHSKATLLSDAVDLTLCSEREAALCFFIPVISVPLHTKTPVSARHN